MPTKLSRYADGVMEAAWLAALIVTPIFFNVYSSRIFEPDKITLLRTLALVILGAWAVKLIEQGGARWEQLQPADAAESRFKSLMRQPMLPWVAGLAVLYLVSTIFSVSPYTSLWGSYQRLQGTYTTFSYLVIFASMLGNLRQRVQIERLVTTAVLSTLPITLYGVLQHYGVDPIPWGGDVTQRIAANMGNSIFVAAFLIMVFPLTVMRIVEAFEALLHDRGRPGLNFMRATGYIFIGALQLIATYYSGSRGPWLGLGASLVLLWLGLSLIWKARWMTISGVVVALSAGIFLVLLNIPNGPLESLRTRPEMGRLGQLLDAESRTGRVRVLIWKGAAELVQPHDPIKYPDGSTDTFNFLRPLIGYGPESMYVAYNPFYQPELTQVEKRNASPDRSHNETWDSLVITGVLGLVFYLAIFGSIIYYALRWLGLVRSSRQRNLFLVLYLLGGALTTAGFVTLRGIAYLGVALPFGMIVGVILYMIMTSLSGQAAEQNNPDQKLRSYLLLGLVAAVVAHFLEINFGIAIVATRTYFWTYAGLILLAGYVLPRHGEYQLEEAAPAAAPASMDGRSAAEPAPAAPGAARTSRAAAMPARKKQRTTVRPSERNWLERLDPWLHQALIVGTIMAIVMTCLGYDYISNASRSKGVFELIWTSLTSLGGSSGARSSLGLLALMITTWLFGNLILVSESSLKDGKIDLADSWPKMFGVSLALSLGLALIFWVWHAAGLVAINKVSATTIDMVMDQVKTSEGILTRFYVFLFLLVFGMGALLPQAWQAGRNRWGIGSLAVGAGLLVVLFGVAAYTNLRVIQADMAFKTAELFARPGTWPVSIQIYDRARDLAPSEDYYYLFLGRAYLEYAKTLENPAEREQLIREAAEDLKVAQQINPLNTDHTANLARLHSLWASYTEDAGRKAERAKQADQYFSWAVQLSPQNARLWDEWAVHELNSMNQPEQAKEHLDKALTIDPYYDWTYGLLADYYARFVAVAPGVTPEQKETYMKTAIENYAKAVQMADPANPSMKYGYLVALAAAHNQLGQAPEAIQAYIQALDTWKENPERWRVEIAIAQLYAQGNDMQHALEYARLALADAPEEQKEAMRNMITQLGGQP